MKPLLLAASLLLLLVALAGAADISTCTSFENDTAYSLTADIDNSGATCMVMANNSMLDCQGHYIDGTKASNTYGVYANNSVNVTVFNCTITEFNQGLLFNYTSASNVSWVNSSFHSTHGLRLLNSSGNWILNNTANNNSQRGIWLDLSSTNNTVAFNFANNNSIDGIMLNDSSSHNNVSFNTADFNTQHGVYNYLQSHNNTYVGNTFLGDKTYGVRLFNSWNLTLINNTILGGWGATTAGGVRMYQCVNMTLINNTIANSARMGLEIVVSSQSGSFVNNTIFNNSMSGINIESTSHNNVFTGNNISSNGYAGYNTSSLSVVNETLLNNTIASNGWNSAIGSGLRIFFNNHLLFNNTIFNNSWVGIHLNANNTWVDGNNITGNLESGVWMRNSRSGNFTNNIIASNGDGAGTYNGGFYIDNTANNNNFTNNTISGSATYDIEVGTTTDSTGNIFLNTSFNWSKVLFPTGSNQTVQWYTNVNVTATDFTPISGAYVNITNATSSTPRLQLNTGADGTTGWQLMSQWWGNSASNVSFTPHNVSVNYSTADYAANYSLFQVNATGYVLVLLQDAVAPSITLNAPADVAVLSGHDVDFNGTPSDNLKVQNVSLFLNTSGIWTANATNSSPFNNTLTNFTVLGLPDGVYLWNLRACDPDGNCAFAAANRTLIVSNSAIRPSSESTNASTPVIGDVLEHRVFWQSFSSANLSGFIFSSNYSGAWANASFTPFADVNSSWSNVSAQTNATVNGTWGWRVYANDTTGAWNATALQTIALANVSVETLAINFPVNGSTQNFPFNFSATVTGNNATYACSYRLDGGAYALPAATNNTAFYAEISGSNALHALNVTCTNTRSGVAASNTSALVEFWGKAPSGNVGGGGIGGAQPSPTPASGGIERELAQQKVDQEAWYLVLLAAIIIGFYVVQDEINAKNDD